MSVYELIPENVFTDLRASGKRQVLQSMAKHASEIYKIDSDIILKSVLSREKLGSTGVGNGVAIPHARIEGLNTISGLFARLQTPTEFNAIDDRPVDLVFMLLAPKKTGVEHLQALAHISRLLRRKNFREALRNAPNSEAIYALLSDQEAFSIAS